MRRGTSLDCSKTSKPSTRTVPLVAGMKPGDDAHRGRLAGAVRAEEAENLTGLRRERHVADRRPFAVPFAQVRDFDHVVE